MYKSIILASWPQPPTTSTITLVHVDTDATPTGIVMSIAAPEGALGGFAAMREAAEDISGLRSGGVIGGKKVGDGIAADRCRGAAKSPQYRAHQLEMRSCISTGVKVGNVAPCRFHLLQATQWATITGPILSSVMGLLAEF